MIVLGKRLLVRPLPREETSKGGIILPANESARIGRAKIEAVGHDINCWRSSIGEFGGDADLVGMTVYYVDAPGVGAPLRDGTLLLHEDQVLVIDDEEA